MRRRLQRRRQSRSKILLITIYVYKGTYIILLCIASRYFFNSGKAFTEQTNQRAATAATLWSIKIANVISDQNAIILLKNICGNWFSHRRSGNMENRWRLEVCGVEQFHYTIPGRTSGWRGFLRYCEYL